MRRIILQPGEQFTNAHLKRTGAFNAQALTAATAIIEGVRERGDEALRAYTEQFDGVRVEEFRVSQAAIAEAIVNVDDKTARALRQAAAQIRDFHERQKQQSWFTVREDGALVGSKVEPLESVGIYVPGGRALYPSSVLMNALLMPITYRFGAAKSRAYLMFIVFAIVFGACFAAQEILQNQTQVGIAGMNTTLQAKTALIAGIIALSLLFTAVLYAISYTICVRVYAKKEK